MTESAQLGRSAPQTASHSPLREHQRLATTGARCVHPFDLAGELYLAVPQFAKDIPGQTPSMHVGNSNVDMPIYSWRNGKFTENDLVTAPGCEDVEFFHIGDEVFLATCCARTGSTMPYESNTQSKIFKWNGGAWTEFQSVPGLVAKQWRHFCFDGRFFLALALGIVGDNVDAHYPRHSCIFEWNGSRFLEFQIFDGRWGYDWEYFELEGNRFLAYADHHDGSFIYRWNGEKFEYFQFLAQRGGRTFKFFEADGNAYLAFANILGDSALCRWNGKTFSQHQVLPGAAGRGFAVVISRKDTYLIRINFIEGTPALPKTDLRSQVYRLEDGRLRMVQEFPTNGGTDAAVFEVDGKTFVAVSNSLTPQVRFRQDTVIYEFTA